MYSYHTCIISFQRHMFGDYVFSDHTTVIDVTNFTIKQFLVGLVIARSKKEYNRDE